MVSQSRSHSARPRLVLFVDSDADTHDLYRTFLVPHRYIVDHAVDGRSALATALASPPDIVVTETQVPGLDGISLCALLHEDPATRSVPVIVLTADARPQLHVEAYRAGASRVLVKPCLPQDLWRQLESLRAQPHDSAARPAVEQRIRHRSAHACQRSVTTTPPRLPPDLRCPQCNAGLAYERSEIRGATVQRSEQWDFYHCPTGCGEFQYRQRTRKVTHSAA